MRLPKEIRIGNKVYEIKVVDKSHLGDCGSVLSGSIGRPIIELNKDLTDEEKINALAYESIQIIVQKAKSVSNMSELLAKMFRDNDFSFMKIDESDIYNLQLFEYGDRVIDGGNEKRRRLNKGEPL